jgi:hypothetical protein
MCGWSLNATFCRFCGLCATADQLLRRFEEPVPAYRPEDVEVERENRECNRQIH